MDVLQEPLPVLIYQREGETITEVRLEGETVWLTQRQMAELFDTSSDNIGLHLKNIFGTGELEESATTEEYSVVRQEGSRQVTRQLRHYNLDAIISVGYRVNSRQGTRFRIWANRVLKDHLLQGYSLNRRSLELQRERIEQLQKTLTLFREGLIEQASLPEARGLVSVIAGYARTFVLLNQFDSERLARGGFAEDIHCIKGSVIKFVAERALGSCFASRRVTFLSRRNAAHKKVTKSACPNIRVWLRQTPLAPSLRRGHGAKGHPWPCAPLAASMPLVPLYNDSTRPAEGAGLLPHQLHSVSVWIELQD